MGLLGEFVIRVAVGINRLIQLFKGHEGMHKLVIGMEEATEPLLILNEMNLQAKNALAIERWVQTT